MSRRAGRALGSTVLLRLAVRSTALASGALAAGCAAAGPRATRVAPPVVTGQTAVALTGGPNASLVYAARTPGGVVLVDLGWWGHERAVARALADLGAGPADVTDVFLTHAHRDHVAAWRTVRHARFHLAAAEADRLTGRTRPRGWIPRGAERLRPTRLPRPGAVAVRAFAADTAFVFGAGGVRPDTLRAYLVPGHTDGSAVYLFRGVLLLGDAVTHTRRGGFAPARRGYSDDARSAAASLRALWPRLPAGAVRVACTAHARCAAFTPAFLADVAR